MGLWMSSFLILGFWILEYNLSYLPQRGVEPIFRSNEYTPPHTHPPRAPSIFFHRRKCIFPSPKTFFYGKLEPTKPSKTRCFCTSGPPWGLLGPWGLPGASRGVWGFPGAPGSSLGILRPSLGLPCGFPGTSCGGGPEAFKMPQRVSRHMRPHARTHACPPARPPGLTNARTHARKYAFTYAGTHVRA